MRRKLTFENTISLLAFGAASPGFFIAAFFLWRADLSTQTRWTLLGFALLATMAFVSSIRRRIVRPLQTISNLVAALGEEDYSIRATGARRGDALGEVMLELNGLGEGLRRQRLGAKEATALLGKVMEEIDVAIFAFDHAQRLRLLNPAASRLLNQPIERVVGATAKELGLAQCLEGESNQTLSVTFPSAPGRWAMRRSQFRQDGTKHQLLVLADLSQALREEERLAWQRLLRVLGHEVNNSLAPIRSLAGSVKSLLAKPQPPPDWKEDADRGLSIIASRSEALGRFLDGYSKLARLPQPKRQSLAIGTLLQHCARLETRVAVEVERGPDLTIDADRDQLEQLLINLLRNAADAALEKHGVTGPDNPSSTKPEVRAGWELKVGILRVWISDNGPGIANASNLFVPFFTTKPGGSGIGLVLCRQIAESHQGRLTLQNREDGQGSVARLELPTR
jgi:two-component system nitrogen regulation sensor histidine kinase NtrY